jgi:PTS system mannose-specific IIA component
MVGIVIVTHGKFADGLLDAVHLIAGLQEKIEQISLKEGDSVELLKSRISETVKNLDDGDGVLVFVDMFGASPCNAAAALFQEHVEVVTGVNLRMILEILNLRTSVQLKELADIAMEAGKESIKNLTDMVRDSLKKKDL